MVRQKKGWNLAEAAEACGIPEATWREWELNGRTPRNISEIAIQISDHADGVDDYWLSTGRTDGIYPDGPGGEVTRLYPYTPPKRAAHLSSIMSRLPNMDLEEVA